MARPKIIQDTVPVMRMAHPLAFAGFLRSIGAPVDSAFRRARLPLLCEDPKRYVPVKSARSFYEDMSKRETEALGWATGQWSGEKILDQGLLRHLATAPTLGRALQDFSALASAENSHIRLGITVRAEDALFWVHDAFDQNTPGYLVAQGYSLEIMLAVLRHFAGRSWLPTEVGVQAQSLPKFAAQILPGTRIRVAQKVGYIAFPRPFLSLPPDRQWVSHFDTGTTKTSLLLTQGLKFSDSLALVLNAYLSEGCPPIEQAAVLIGVSSRTIKRRLESEGLSYSSVVDRVRFDVAQRLLRDPDIKMIDISSTLGYSDSSHFARSFRRISGVSPSTYRRNILQLASSSEFSSRPKDVEKAG